ncbi:tyrosine-type recombinase/integrase [Streptomyces sp. NPDC088847]|uniref:tyrosine-type recombinase/integrase n=1 Tax=Streptomyces sp. NPDC088847 TaxID=3365909 RepID=UPI00380E15F5
MRETVGFAGLSTDQGGSMTTGVNIKRVLKCDACGRMTTESATKGKLVAHSAKARQKCPSTVPAKRSPIRYRAIVDCGNNPATGKRIQTTVTADTVTEVKNKIARLTIAKDEGAVVAPTKMTVADLLDSWLSWQDGEIEATTVNTYRNYCTHVYERLGSIKLQKLTRKNVEDFRDYLLTSGRKSGGTKGTGLAYVTVQGIIGRLREALSYAQEERWITFNVAAKVKMPKSALEAKRRADRKRPAPWGNKEVEQFIDGIEGDRYEAPLLLSLMGLRPAEVCGLKWEEHIDFASKTIDVGDTRTLMSRKGMPKRVVEKGPKTVAGDRVLPLPAMAYEALAASKVVQDVERLTAGEAYTDSGEVFVDELGNALTTQDLRAHAYKLMAKLGLRRVRLYDARHSCMTYLNVTAKVPDVVLARWAGHTNANFTKAKYVHVDPEELRQATDAFDAGLMRQRRGGDARSA